MSRGSTWQWRKLRAQIITEQPTCQLRLDGCTHISTTADHIIPRSLAPQLEYVRENLQGSCSHCNTKRGNNPVDYKQPAKALAFFR